MVALGCFAGVMAAAGPPIKRGKQAPAEPAAPPRTPPVRRRERERDPDEREPPPRDRGLDPLERALYEPWSSFRPPAAPPIAPAPSAAPPPALEALVDRFLRRVAVSGDRNRGVAHLEMGEGVLGGGTVTITADGRTVQLKIDAPASAGAEQWGEQLAGRLRARGFEVELEFV